MRRCVWCLLLVITVGNLPVFVFAEQRDKTMSGTPTYLKDKFDTLADQWAAHCQSVMLSSNINDYLDHPTYDQLIALGKPAIPYIIERYKRDDLPWGFVLDDITGLRIIENRQRFSPPQVKKRWLEWWEQQSGQRRNLGL